MADDTRLSKRQLKKLVKEQGTVIKRDPNNLVARLKLAGALKDLGNGKEAVSHYQAVAQAYVESGKLVQAISVYKGILELSPGDVNTEAALTELSARRAQEIKKKSLPRLQQVDGRWVMPTESSASEDEGTDPGKEAERSPSATASVLRLPAHVLSSDAPSTRRPRRSRPRLPSLDSGAPVSLPPDLNDVDEPHDAQVPTQENEEDVAKDLAPLPPLAPIPVPLSFDSGLPTADMAPQASLPNLFRAGQEGEEVVASGAQAAVPESSELHPEPEIRAQEEPTSPGPGSYSDTIRKSAVRLDIPPMAATSTPPPVPRPMPQVRRTIVGVPLPDHPDLVGPPLDSEVFSRPTPSVPLPAIARDSKGTTDLPGSQDNRDTRTAKEGDSPPEAGEAHETRALRRVNGPAMGTPFPSLPLGDASDATMESVFDEDEEALWAELSGGGGGDGDETQAASMLTEPDRSTRSLKPAVPTAGSATPDRLPRATLPLPSLDPRPEASQSKKPPTGFSSRANVSTESSPEPVSKEPSPEPVSLESIPLFRDLSEASRELLTSRVITRREKAGAEVVREGDPGNALFVVSAGRVKVTKAGQDGLPVHLATLGPGAFFGEFALLSDRKRHATVSAEEDTQLFEISRKVIADLTRGEPAFGNTLRAFYRRRLLATLLGSAPFFESLSDEERESLMGRLRFRRVAEGTKIITEGEPGGGFYLILIGQVQVIRTEPDGSQRVLANLGDGAYFGEMSLLKGGNAVATVTTVAPTEIVQLAAAEFYRILSKYPKIWEDVNQEAKRRALANLQILTGSSPSTLSDEDGVVM